MSRPISIAILVIGIIFLVWGFSASDSIASEASEAVTGAPNDRTIWLFVVGVIGTLVGGFGLVRRG